MHEVIINVKAEAGLIRNEQFNSADHLVVPMVGLVEGVMTSANAESPALALAEEFAKGVGSWNGRPVVINHPKDKAGNPVSANSPEVLEDELIGQLFNAKVEEGKLKFEAWINIEDAKSKGDEGVQVIEMLTAGELMEISTGLYAEEEPNPGSHNGVKFQNIWRNISPDHLALLPNGIGACSVADGCGAPRINEEDQFCCTPCSQGKTCMKDLGVVSKFLSKFGVKTNRTDSDVRIGLQAALEATSNDFAYIHSVLNDGTFIFETWDGFFQQSFEFSEDGTITLGGEPVHVRPETNFVPVNVEVKENAVDKTAKINALIASENVPFDEEDRNFLEALDERKIDALMQDNADPTPAPEPAPTPVPAPEPVVAEVAQVSAQEYIDSAPAEVAEVLQHGLTMRQDRIDGIITGILANDKNIFVEDELRAMPLANLEKMASLAAVDDYTLRGGPRTIDALAENAAPKPPLVFENVGRKATAA